MITAQRRSEQLQKVPVAVTALSASEMESKQIRRMDDLKYEVPNIVIEQNTVTSSGAKIFMRGVGTDDSLFTTDPSVAIYIDDMYVARQTGALFDMFDLQRVEVLRGRKARCMAATPPGRDSLRDEEAQRRIPLRSRRAPATWVGWTSASTGQDRRRPGVNFG
jgi:iron complex outermembrane receptor protein